MRCEITNGARKGSVHARASTETIRMKRLYPKEPHPALRAQEDLIPAFGHPSPFGNGEGPVTISCASGEGLIQEAGELRDWPLSILMERGWQKAGVRFFS